MGIAMNNHSPVFKVLKAALRDHKALSRPNGGKDPIARENYVARVNGRIDRAYELPVNSIAEAAVKLRLVIESDGDVIDLPVLDALKTVSAFLDRASTRGGA